MGFWVTAFFVNWIINILMVEFLGLRKLGPIIKVDEERDSKYHAFRRLDVKWFNRPFLYMLCHLTLIRYILAFSALFGMACACNFCSLGWDMSKPYTGWRHRLCTWAAHWTGVLVAMLGTGSMHLWKSRPKVCYKKYLGPDWVADYDTMRCGTIVANHQSFFDTLLHSQVQIPSFIAKQEVKQIPFISTCCQSAQCIFVDFSSKESRRRVAEQIQERQKECEENPDLVPLIVHVEGGTTNGKYLINFKKGAFASLRSIQPVVHKYHSNFQSASSGILDGMPNYMINGSNFFTTTERIELPVFRPNDYFFEHHVKEGEEKWQAYLRVIRSLMSEHGDLPLSDLQIEDKVEYKKLLFPKKQKAQ